MMLDVVSIFLSGRLFVLIPMLGGFLAEHLSVAWLVNFLAQFIGIGIAFSVAYLPVVLPSLLTFRMKLDNHAHMFEQCKSFRLAHAKCTLESDRNIVEQLVKDLFSHSSDPIKEFDRFVAEDLSRHVAASVGGEAGLPYKLCLLAYLPLAFSAAANILGCDDMPCDVAAGAELGAGASAAQQMLTNLLAWSVGVFGIYPSTLPVLLALMAASRRHFAGRPGARFVGDCLAIVAANLYMGFHEGFAAGLVNTASAQGLKSSAASALWGSATVAYLALLVVWNRYLFNPGNASTAALD